METLFVLLIVALCAIILIKKICKQIKGGKCDCGCGCNNNCGSCSKSNSCITQLMRKNKKDK
ncbi:FeoB-associated Cys-rich membrane protein [Candidatus Ruminimicrobium bovinum]|uniref:FeoB-associated Cys-rich membrane protein n=1 Tax=Candidatus Ruminimicrobium bovinum TaxID=3242779 RepID=UPI0039B976BC